MLSIEEIKNISFRKAGIGGYKPEDVDAFIDQVLITMEQLRKEKSDLVKKMDILATRVEEYRADEDAVRNTMLSAQRVADNTVKEARAKAARMIEESENMAKAKLYDLNVQIKKQKKQYTLLLAECNRVRDEIINNCNKHIIIANELPSADRIQAMESSVNEKYPTDNSNDYERATEISAPVQPSVEDAQEARVPEVNFPLEDPKSEKNEEIVTDENKPATIDDEINIITDLGEKDNFDVDRHEKKEKKKSKGFGVLKFGDNYDLNNDEDDASNNN